MRDPHRVQDAQRPLQPQALEDDGCELQREHRGVEHHAVGHLEHHRVRVAHDERVPDAVVAAQVEDQRHDTSR